MHIFGYKVHMATSASGFLGAKMAWGPRRFGGRVLLWRFPMLASDPDTASVSTNTTPTAADRPQCLSWLFCCLVLKQTVALLTASYTVQYRSEPSPAPQPPDSLAIYVPGAIGRRIPQGLCAQRAGLHACNRASWVHAATRLVDKPLPPQEPGSHPGTFRSKEPTLARPICETTLAWNHVEDMLVRRIREGQKKTCFGGT